MTSPQERNSCYNKTLYTALSRTNALQHSHTFSQCKILQKLPAKFVFAAFVRTQLCKENRAAQPTQIMKSIDANLLSRIAPRHWGYLSLLFWAAAVLLLLRQDSYSLDEGAAKCLLLVWSVADQIASSVVTFGAPDFRILLFIPAGFLWTGSIFAAKIFTVLAIAVSAWLLFSWKLQTSNTESALLGTGLLIISPLMLAQIDSLSPSVFLLFTFALGAWLNKEYRTSPVIFGGWYFSQLFICALSVSLHPAGLAYPLSLLWSWYKEPLDHKQQKYFYIGIGFAVLSTLLIRMGWHDLEWLQNPLKNLANIVLGPPPDNDTTVMRWIAGSAIALTLAAVALKQYRILWQDFTGRILLLGLMLGIANSDPAWAMIALATILYFGLPLLLRPQPSATGGFLRQRGTVVALICILSTLFMLADKAHYKIRQFGILPEQDQLIRTLAEEAESARKAAEETENAPLAQLRVASQWPSRTMIACKCDTLPLPPAAKDAQTQLDMLHSITHLLFNPQQPANLLLARNLAVLGGGVSETIALQPEGALLHFKNTNNTATGK